MGSRAYLKTKPFKISHSQSFCFGYKFNLFNSPSKSFGELKKRAEGSNNNQQPYGLYLLCLLHNSVDKVRGKLSHQA
jgi:hypothetical protein